MPELVYRIANWQSYETAQSRKVARLDWVPRGMPDLKFALVMSRPEGLKAFGLFMLLVQYVAGQHMDVRDGWITQDGRAGGVALDAEDIAMYFRCDAADVAAALALLCEPKVGLIDAVAGSREEAGRSVGDSREILGRCLGDDGRSVGDSREILGRCLGDDGRNAGGDGGGVSDKTSQQEREKRERREQNRTEEREREKAAQGRLENPANEWMEVYGVGVEAALSTVIDAMQEAYKKEPGVTCKIADKRTQRRWLDEMAKVESGGGPGTRDVLAAVWWAMTDDGEAARFWRLRAINGGGLRKLDPLWASRKGGKGPVYEEFLSQWRAEGSPRPAVWSGPDESARLEAADAWADVIEVLRDMGSEEASAAAVDVECLGLARGAVWLRAHNGLDNANKILFGVKIRRAVADWYGAGRDGALPDVRWV